MNNRHEEMQKEEKPKHKDSLCFSMITCHFLTKCLKSFGGFFGLFGVFWGFFFWFGFLSLDYLFLHSPMKSTGEF